ncbi:MAG TPA: ABC transporter permease, partial [Longimicrobiales bacterium]|nr:ABC transporter permease [Longimicrobiales bacterium]
MSAVTRVLRRVLRLAPAWFRDRYADELVETYRARRADAMERGRTASIVLGVREVAGLVVLVVRLRLGRGAGPEAAGLGPSRLDVVRQDVRFALRGLRRNPGYAMAALVVLAVGIGANTAMFSAVNAFFFRPLPFADADRLVMLYETNPEFEWTDADAAPANVLDWRERVGAFEDVAAYSELGLARIPYVRDGEPVLIATTSVTGNFFSVLGVRAAIGRTLTWEETWQGSDAVVLGDGVWRTHFGADPGIVDRTITLGSREVRVVGVMPAGFSFPNDETQLWMPWGWDPASYEQVFFRRAHWVRPIARLAPGVTLEQADAEFQAVVAQLQREFPETNRVMGAGMMPVRDFLIRDVRRPLLTLL